MSSHRCCRSRSRHDYSGWKPRACTLDAECRPEGTQRHPLGTGVMTAALGRLHADSAPRQMQTKVPAAVDPP